MTLYQLTGVIGVESEFGLLGRVQECVTGLIPGEPACPSSTGILANLRTI